MAFFMGLSAALCHILIKENKATFTAQRVGHFMVCRNDQLVSAGLFFYSFLPQFLEWTLAGMPGRILIWFATLTFSLTVSAGNRNK